MTMHHVDVSLRFGVSADDRSRPTPTISRASAADATVCEWAVDLDMAGLTGTVVETSLASTGFVDFDAIDTLHRPIVDRR